MMHFDEWWNSAAADSFRAKHEDLDGEVFRTVWDAAQLGQAAAPQAVHPENIRKGAPYDNPEFEQLARAMGIWGTPQAALCAQFWLAATHPTQQGLDAETQRHAAIGKAIERACMDLPDGTEISVSLEKDAGTVTLIDQDGNEHENFSTDYGFAGVLNEAIDTALSDQAKKGEQAS